MSILNSPAINGTAIEETLFKLFYEWLKKYFDGNPHTIGKNDAKPFPNAEVLSQQMAIPQPLNGVAISMVWVTAANPRTYWGPWRPDVNAPFEQQQLALVDASLMFIVRAQVAESGDGNSASKARATSDLLFAILSTSKEFHALAQKGVSRLRPTTPQLLSEGPGAQKGDPAYAMRSVMCRMRLTYPVLSQCA